MTAGNKRTERDTRLFRSFPFTAADNHSAAVFRAFSTHIESIIPRIFAMSSADCQKFCFSIIFFVRDSFPFPHSIKSYLRRDFAVCDGYEKTRRLLCACAQRKINCKSTQLLRKREFIERFFKSSTDIAAFAFFLSIFVA